MKQRLNLMIDEALYEQARRHSYEVKKSISAMVRESLRDYLEKAQAPEIEKQSYQNFSGLWQGRDINLQEIRDKAWKK